MNDRWSNLVRTRLRADGLSLMAAHALACREVAVVFGAQCTLGAPDGEGRAETLPRWFGGEHAAQALETKLLAHGFSVLRLNGPDGWCLVVDLMACPEGGTSAEREAIATRCARIEEIALSRRPRHESPFGYAEEAAKHEWVLCMGQTVVTLRARLASSEWVLDNHYGDGSDAGRADRRSMTEALAAYAAAISREVARRDMAHGERYRYAAEIEGLARSAAREERRLCECLDLARLRDRAREADLRVPDPPGIRAAAILFLLAASQGFELMAVTLRDDDEQTVLERNRLLRSAADTRAAYTATHGARVLEAQRVARMRPRATAWLEAGLPVESPLEHATIDGVRTVCGLLVAGLTRLAEDHGKTDCSRCGVLLSCGGRV